MKTKVLVTGSNGLVGKSLQKIINNKDHDFYKKYQFIFLTRQICDLRSEEEVNCIFDLHNPDIVVHLASRVGGVYENIDKNYLYLMDNIKINTNIVTACEKYNVKKLINILSTCIFPDKNIIYPLTNDQLHNGLPHNSNIGYAFSKRILHLASELLADTKTNFQVINLIPTNLYGENDNYNLQSSHVIPGLIHKVYNAKINNTDLQVMGTGIAVRQFLYADDLSNIIIEFIKNYNTDQNTISCITSPPESCEISIQYLVEYITNIMNFTGKIIYDNVSSDGQYKKTTNDEEIKKYIPNFIFTDLKDGLKKTIDFFITNYDFIRK